jgi:predicted outer membrane repeat protein
MLVLLVANVGGAKPHPHPPIVVGSGDAASCTEDALRDAVSQAAVAGGGTIRFDCGNDPVTITLASPPPPPPNSPPLCRSEGIVLPDHTTIDGGGTITLAQSPTSLPCFTLITMLSIGPDVTAAVKDLNVLNTVNTRHHQVTAVANQGRFEATNVTVTGFTHALDNPGTASLKKTTIQQSGDEDGMVGPVVNSGVLRLDDSALIDNFFGAIYSLTGTLDIKNSLFQSNSGSRRGGAIRAGGDVSIKNSRFIGNNAVDGGAIFNEGSVTIKNSILSGNTADTFSGPGGGGAVFNRGRLTIENSTLSDNQASFCLSSSCAGFGGAVYTTGPFDGTLVIRNSDITSNTAGTDGGGIYVTGNSPAPTLTHVKFANNTPNDIAPLP